MCTSQRRMSWMRGGRYGILVLSSDSKRDKSV